MKLETLSEYCIRSLVQNKEQFPIIGNMPFRLLKDYLKRINVSVTQLMKYEKYNVEWIFDDDEEMWGGLLKSDFPTNIHEQYVHNKEKIIEYYKDSLRSMIGLNLEDNDSVIAIVLRNRISQAIKRDPKTHKYKKPFRMLYLQYQDEIKLKEAQVAENLRLQMQKVQEERAKKATVAVGEKFFIANTVGKRKRQSSTPIWKPAHKREHVEVQRRQVDRVAFGGMAGRKINPDAFKVVSRDPPLAITPTATTPPPRGSSPTKYSEQNEHRSKPPALLTAPRKQQARNPSGQNIFLTKRPRPMQRSPQRQESMLAPANVSTTTANQGSKKKPSSIFQRQPAPIHTTHKPHATASASTANSKFNSNKVDSSNNTNNEQRVHSLSFYLQKIQNSKIPKK